MIRIDRLPINEENPHEMFYLRATDNGAHLCNGGASGKDYPLHIYFNAVITEVIINPDGSVELVEGHIRTIIKPGKRS